MSLKAKILLALFFIAYLSIHLYTLNLNPLPWFDEVFFASTAKGLQESGRLIPQAYVEIWNKGVYHHGPIHFLLGNTSFKLFGFGIIQYRSIIFLFGLLTLLATINLVRQYITSDRLIVFLAVCFALDPFTNQSMHDGRMDFEVIFFMLVSILLLVKGLQTTKSIYLYASGAFAVLSLLTSPRIGFVYISMFIAFLLQLEGKSIKGSLFAIAKWILPVALIYTLWTFYAFGGFTELYNYYSSLNKINTEPSYLWGSLYIPKHEYILIAITILSIIYGIVKMRGAYFTIVTIIALFSIASFYIIVKDWGSYSILIIPFYYYLVFFSFGSTSLSFKNIATYPLLILFVYNLSFFGIKTLQILSEKDIRNPKVAEDFVSQHIPKGSKVIGDASYYYAVINSGSEYRCFENFLSDSERERLLRETYDYDYIIITSRSLDRNKSMVELFLKNALLKPVAELTTKQTPLGQKMNSLGILSTMESSGYNAAIFVRIKENYVPLAYAKID